MPPKKQTNNEDQDKMLANLEFVSEFIEHLPLELLGPEDRVLIFEKLRTTWQAIMMDEISPLVSAAAEKDAQKQKPQATLNKKDPASIKACQETISKELNQIQALVTKYIQKWKKHRDCCDGLEQAGVLQSKRFAAIEEEILCAVEKLHSQAKVSFGVMEEKMNGQLLTPVELELAEALEKIRKVERHNKELDQELTNLKKKQQPKNEERPSPFGGRGVKWRAGYYVPPHQRGGFSPRLKEPSRFQPY